MLNKLLQRLGLTGLVALLALGNAAAQEIPEPKARSTFSELVIGLPFDQQPVEFQQYACGTNGGPPSLAMKGFGDFAQCPVEAETGLHEITFRYDDEAEYWALAHNLQVVANRYHGTTAGNHEIIASALFDDGGILRGVRAVTDDRTTLRGRFTAYQVADYIYQMYAPDPWDCVDLPVREGETPVAQRLIKQNCVGLTKDGVKLHMETRLLRRAGQKMIDPFSGEVRGDRFVAGTRFLLLDPKFSVAANTGVDR
ncbi:MAG: hypothetical protein EOP22_06115 [Hyphomicrobiales bacterium]|nr:MAG: hypothetical protein EOP22_06115 [Hyphomicrobiales bacterium]